MLVTERLNSPTKGLTRHHGLCYWTDKQTQRPYFYVSFLDNFSRKWKVYRFGVNESPLEWEFVVQVDYEMKNAGVSPCGLYFWSVEIKSPQQPTDPQQLLIHQLNVRTCETSQFDLIDITPPIPNDINFIRFFYTEHNGMFMFINSFQYNYEDLTHTEFDTIFRVQFNETKKKMQLKRVILLELPTTALYPVNNFDTVHYGDCSTGLIELNKSVYFYRIDYFGDLHVLEWKERVPYKELMWIPYSIEGNYRPGSWMLFKDQDFYAHRSDSRKKWRASAKRLQKSSRFYLSDGVVYEHNHPSTETVFYKLDFYPQNQTCKCTQMFKTVHLPRQDQFAFLLYTPNTPIFAIKSKNDSPLIWEVIFCGQVPSLRHITYWNVRRQLREPTARFSIKIVGQRIVAVIFRRKDAIRRETEEKELKLPKPTLFLREDQQKVVARVSREQIMYLMRMLH